jgi:hypothetical protein
MGILTARLQWSPLTVCMLDNCVASWHKSMSNVVMFHKVEDSHRHTCNETHQSTTRFHSANPPPPPLAVAISSWALVQSKNALHPDSVSFSLFELLLPNPVAPPMFAISFLPQLDLE